MYIPLATTRRTHSTKFSRVFAFMIVLCFRGVFEGARRNGTIRLAQFNHFRGEKHNCLLPLPLSWCYACCVCCASCVFRSGASESASGSLPTRSTRSAGAKRCTPIIPPPIFFLPCFHPCTLPQTCTGSQWNSNVRIPTTIAFCLCVGLGATLPTCVGCYVCCRFSLLTLPLEPFYACYVLCSMFLSQHS